MNPNYYQFSQVSDAPETQELVAMITRNRNNCHGSGLALQQSHTIPRVFSFFSEQNTLYPDDHLNPRPRDASDAGQSLVLYDPLLPPPLPTPLVPTPYSCLIPDLPAPIAVLEPAEKAVLITEGTAEAYLKLYKHGELKTRIVNGAWELCCIAECWVRTGIPSHVPLATPGQFATLESHSRGKSCKANTQKLAIQESHAALTTIFPSGTQKQAFFSPSTFQPPSLTLSRASNATLCPGLKIVDWPALPDVPICANFPWLRMREGPDQLPFEVELIARSLSAWSHLCIGFLDTHSLDPDSPQSETCSHCASLVPKVALLAKNAQELNPHTRRSLQTPVQLLEVAKRLDEQVNSLKLQTVNDARKINHLRNTLSDNSALIMALSQQDVPYLRQLLSTSLRNGASVRKILRTLEDALEHGYRPRNHSRDSLDLAALIYRLGGQNLLYALNQRFPLPSLRTLRNHTSFTKIAPTVGRIIATPIAQNLKSLLINTRQAESPQRGVSILIDETALEEAAVYIPDLNAVGGLCWLHAHNVDITLRSYQSALGIMNGLKDGKVHLAKEVTVIVVHLFGEDGVYPLLAAPTCKREQAKDMAFILQTVIDTYISSDAEKAVGPLWTIATDGDATRRKACHQLLVHEKLPIDHPLYGTLSNVSGINLYTGPFQITLDPDFKHNIKRFSTALRSCTGIYVNGGHCINTFMLERYLTWLDDVDETMARRLLYPDDPQDVPRAVELLGAIIQLGRIDPNKNCGIFDVRVNATTASDFDALSLLSFIYDSLLEPFVNVNLSLSQQVTSLSRLAHLLFACYRNQGRRFIPNPLYYDTQSMIKSIVFNIAKQQNLDPTAPYAIVEGGDDALESLFAFLRMSGGHHSALNHREANDRLGAARDIADVFSRNPDLDSGHRRLNLKRKESVDHISRSNWVGDIISGNCDLPSCWIHGQGEAVQILKATKVPPACFDFETLFSNGNFDLLRVFGGNRYPSIDIGGDEDDENMLVDAGTASAQDLEPGSVDETAVDSEQDLEPSFEDELINSFRELEVTSTTQDCGPSRGNFNELVEDHSPNSQISPSPDSPPKGPGVNPLDYLWCERRWVHKQSVCRIVISPNFNPKSHDRLMRVRGFTTVNKYSNGFDSTRILHGDQFIVGDIFLTLLRTHDKKVALALLRATGITENGSRCSSINTDTLVSFHGNVKVNGDVMVLVLSEKVGDPQWAWNGAYSSHVMAVNTPGSATSLVAPSQVSSLTISGQLVEPINPPVLDAHEHLPPAERHQMNSKGTTWVIGDEALKEVIAVLWKRIVDNKIALTGIPSLSGLSDVFPYHDIDGTPALLCLAATDQLSLHGKAGASLCPICGTKTTDMRSHMGAHILRAARGISEPQEPIERVMGSLPCGFCGRTGEPSCDITIKELSKSTQYTTNCPRFTKFLYMSASKGSSNRPCRNVPVVCKLCVHHGRETDTRPGIWRYNMEAHLDYHHPEYAHPGKPDGRALPRDVYESLYLTDDEQRVANVPIRPVFKNIQEKENESATTSARTRKRKNDAETFASAAAANTTGKRRRCG